MIPVFDLGDGTVGALTNISGVVQAPPSIEPIFCKFQWNEIFHSRYGDCLSLPEVTEKMPFPHFNAAKDIVAFYVNDHIFCFFDIDKLNVITVRAIPEDIDEIKAQYTAVGKPYNFSSKDWIGIYPAEGISDDAIKSLILNSYNIVKDE